MHPEKYSLTWHTYSDHLKNMMKELMMNEDFSDVTLVTEDKKEIKANINILSACSPVFKGILKKEKNSSPIIYLRGMQFSEIESILQFIYLGEATFYEERMDEFLAVAKSLEIKELCHTTTKRNYEPEGEPLELNDPLKLNVKVEDMEEQLVTSDSLKRPNHKERREKLSGNGKYDCEPCQRSFSQSTFYRHKRTVHDGVKYACWQCDYQATNQQSLDMHTQAKHEGIKYNCDQCDYQATQQGNLIRHIQSKHEGIKHACQQCDYQASYKGDLTIHNQAKHEGIKYACNQCDHQATQKSSLRVHIRNKHKVVL